ncbi:MAG: Multicopper oxidase [Myxococcaceae bacterium]|nr:Multicopper oxidase [Myxococcaceae bacterium]
MKLTRRQLVRRSLTAAVVWAAGPLALRVGVRLAQAQNHARMPPPPLRHDHGLAPPTHKVRSVPVIPKPLHLDKLARFVDALPIPPRLAPTGSRTDPDDKHQKLPLYEVAMRLTRVKVHRDVPETKMFAYGGSVPGPTFEVRAGKPILVQWKNELPTTHLLPVDHNLCGAEATNPEVRAIVHVHGARVPPESDGYPDDWYAPGKGALTRYPNAQEAATLWYHDHAMGIERLNQYAGLFGMYWLRDDFEAGLALPSGKYELPLVLADRTFDADGQLRYPTSGDPDAPWVPEVYGDAHLVNGKLYPYFEVEPRRYRFRIVNAANARFFYLSLSNGMTFHQLGSDQGLLSAPVPLTQLTLSPGERADIVIDFSQVRGTRIVMRSQAFELMQLRVADAPAVAEEPLPTALRPVLRIAPESAVKTRTLTLNEYMNPKTHQMLMLLNGSYWHDPVTEKPELGSVEIWDLVNLTDDTHPIHLHLVRFQFLHHQRFDTDEYNTSGKLILLGEPVPPEPSEAGWKDTVRVGPGLITRIIVRFEGYAGRYVWHCHVLEHAANEMMRPFEVVARKKRPTR